MVITVQCKKITAAFDAGRITSNGGVTLLAQAERRLGIAERLAQVIPDRRVTLMIATATLALENQINSRRSFAVELRAEVVASPNRQVERDSQNAPRGSLERTRL
jgi:hypothetical protein